MRWHGRTSRGDIASKISAEKFEQVFLATRGDIRLRLKRATESANDALAAKSTKDPTLTGMGSTLVGVYITNEEVNWVSVGDSHLYQFKDGNLEKLNADHSMAPVLDAMAADGRISAEEALSDPQRNALRSALSGGDIELIDLGSTAFDKTNPPQFLLASDGLDTLKNCKIESIIENVQPAEVMASLLIEAVTEARRSRQDNTSIITVTIKAKNKKKRFFGLF